MTSKTISYIKLIRADIRHRGWLLALTSIVLFLAMPVYTTLYLSTYTDLASDLITYFPGLINGNNLRSLAGAIAVSAVLIALTGFSYIHSREKLDFFHSLPVKRTTWFATTYLSGLIIFLVPYVICSILTVIAGAANSLMTIRIVQHSAEAALGGILAFFLIYTAAVFAVMLTGRTVTGLLASLAVIVYPSMIFTMIFSLEQAFFKSYYSYDPNSSLPLKLANYLSPYELFNSLIAGSATGSLHVGLAAAAILISALLIVCAVLLYRAYPSEAAGNTIAFPVTAPVLKVLVCIPTALFVSLAVQELMLLNDTGWIFLLSLLAAVILCAVIEFIYTLDLRQLLRGWKSSLIAVAGVMAVLCIFRFDLLGYDTYLPVEDKVEAICFRPDSFSYYFSYPDSEYPFESELGYFAPEDETDALYSLASSGIENLENGIDVRNNSGYIETLFRYKLSNGRIVSRQYPIKYENAAAALEEVLDNQEYRKELFPYFHFDKNSVISIALSDIYGISDEMELDKKQRLTLLETYERDLLSVSADTLINSVPIGELSVQIPDPEQTEQTVDKTNPSYTTGNSYSSNGFPIDVPQLYLYPEYTNTLALLEDYGYTLRSHIAPEDVSGITVYLYKETVESGKYSDLISRLSDTADLLFYDSEITISVTAQEDIALLLEHIRPYTVKILDDGETREDYIEVQYKNGNFYGSMFVE